MNTRAGDLMVIRAKGANADFAQLCNAMYVILHTDQILEIRDSGCQVFDWINLVKNILYGEIKYHHIIYTLICQAEIVM